MEWYSSLKEDLWNSSFYYKIQTLLLNSAETNPGKTLKLYLLTEGIKSALESKVQDSDRLFELLGLISTLLEAISPLTGAEKEEINVILTKNALPAFFV